MDGPNSGSGTSSQTIRREHSRGIGSSDRGIQFSGVGPIAIDPSGNTLAVVDDAVCQVVLIPVATAESERRLLGCGDGPGEIRSVTGLSFRGDTLILFEATHKALVWILQNGVEVRRITPAIVRELQVSSIWGVNSISDSTLLLGLLLFPTTAGGDGHLLAVVNTLDGSTVRRLLMDPQVSQNSGNVARAVEYCVAHTDSASFVVAFNRWAFEGVIWKLPELEVVAHFVTPLLWSTPAHVESDPTGVVRPGANFPTVGCSAKGVLFRQHQMDLSVDPPKAVGGHLEVRDFSGALLLKLDLGIQDSLMRGLGRAGFGNRLYFSASDPTTHVPVVREWILRELP